MKPLSRFVPAVTVTVASFVTAGGLVSCSADDAAEPAEIRVNQAGYVTGEKKYAYVMGNGDDLADAGFTVVDERGRTVLRGRLGPSTGSWNAAYDTVRTVDLSALRRTGTYRLRLTGSAEGRSPRFRVASAGQLTDALRADSVRFFRTQRDGGDVLPEQTGRVASHLTDERAVVYAPPRYTAGGERTAATALTEVAGPVDVSGGWFDAGDFLKFTHTTSYVVGQLLTAVRDTPPVPGLPAEADHGLDWLDRMWDGPDGVLYAQVGLGSGNARLRGDHDMWRLPEEDDALSVRPGDPDYLVKHRPVFRANTPGDPVSPNLAGRVAAAFALAAQVRAEEDPEVARRWLDKAAEVYARADTDPHGRLFTTVPASYYREDSWRDDMEWAAVELARSARELGDGRSVRWQREAVGWAKAYLQSGERGTLDVSDVSALAHADLLSSPGLDGDTRNALEADLRRQLAEGTRQAARDPFGAGVVLTEFDAVPRTFGLVATSGLYARVTRDHRFDAFASRQRGWVFGANPWGTSFVIGAGETYPHCPEHQVANLAMSRTGRGDILRGAVVNGPNKAELLGDLERFDSMRPCSAEPSGHRWSDFDGHGAGYVDDVAAWQTVEPADDFTATALLALSLTADTAVTELR
ncbi:glycoside hydrolase family 9 protein [Streptomyces sp. NPDC059862]|uniref:glycoside hydrolase family 9 protein n=1 Tax=Streptomyces sp. NPDC059862 TaxID=3346975 RepID=UPI0036485BEF